MKITAALSWAVLASMAAATPLTVRSGDRSHGGGGGGEVGARGEYGQHGEHGGGGKYGHGCDDGYGGHGGKGEHDDHGHGHGGDDDHHGGDGDHGGGGRPSFDCFACSHQHHSKKCARDLGPRTGSGHGDHGGHGGGHDGGHGGHGGHGGGHDGGQDDGHERCPDPNNADDVGTCIERNPGVVVNVTLPLRDNNLTIVEIANGDIVPMVNRTAPTLGDDLPALKNDTTGNATEFGGITSPGMNSTFRPPQGTNKNTDAFTSVNSGSGIGGSGTVVARDVLEHFVKRQGAINTQPDPPPANPDPALACTYTYQSVLGGDGSASRGALWALEGSVDLVAADVQQGGIGDCGMGAAIMALASGGWTPLIKNSFVRVGQGEGSYEVLLKKDGVTERIAIDDKLPVLSNANPNCWPYPGFQPVNDAVIVPGSPRGFESRPIFFMPLFEKAFAKFLDAHPDWKSAPANVTGYAGLEGVNPAVVLAAITGGAPVSIWRTRPGFDGPLIVALLNCMRGNLPCAISTSNSTTLEGLGTVDATKVIWLNPAGDAAVPRGYTPGDTAGMLASDAPGSTSTFTVIDFDQVIKTPDGDRSTALTFVGNHAYGFNHPRSTDFPIPANVASLIDARINILNPWGANPCQWPGGGCGNGGQFGEPSELPFSFRTLAMSIIGVFTVDQIPAQSS